MKAAATIGQRYIFSLDDERLLSQMIAASVVLHVVLFGALILGPRYFNLSALEKPAPETIDIDLSYELPKGPGLGAQPILESREAMRRSDERKSMQIIRDREKEKKEEADVVKTGAEKAPISNKLAFKNQAPAKATTKEMDDAVAKLRKNYGTEGGGGQGAAGTDNFLAQYAAKVSGHLHRAWALPGGLPHQYLKQEIIVYVKISPSGTVTGKSILKGSGYGPLDRSCLMAVQAGSPLPQPPPALQEQVAKGLRITFKVSRKTS